MAFMQSQNARPDNIVCDLKNVITKVHTLRYEILLFLFQFIQD